MSGDCASPVPTWNRRNENEEIITKTAVQNAKDTPVESSTMEELNLLVRLNGLKCKQEAIADDKDTVYNIDCWIFRHRVRRACRANASQSTS